ncbi:F0F1-type ATP synthase assembly protein I [Bacilli bacterium PM5-3]|nr:F0F1-type ATP synthase assembly protein I [Bacilli bacterium PM5-3]MDH6603695.1 F0F1-type ATP synthase assembly protein I [Bacilli bacterium PM5-9]
MEQNKKNKTALRQTISSLTSISGYMIGSILIGMYLDNKFFNNNGLAVIVALIIGILLVVINVIKLVILSRDN